MNDTKYSFNKETRYVTRGINSDIPLQVQIVLWSIIDSHVESENKIDYLQVFRFQVKEGRFFIHHSQEMPNYQKSYEYDMESDYVTLLSKRIYVIDSQNYSTMLLANEY